VAESSGSTTPPLEVAAAAPVAAAEAAGAAQRETMEAAVEERLEEGRLPEDSAVDPATSWEDTPVRKGKLRISGIPLFFYFSLFALT
jgi:hypothetical protein